ncbi:hypothetical protein FNV43_RR09177 [Rhamnella rubrinervis]|uniref:K-box domain-containing protein n=1 Tax=Rhamnella rubrinervis TaxID=2594499 RepID=A0A8K0HA74_9ROSA|nr:hypothetical protein FNV43_RR09177 [Rhamnella rubrinervis]
MNKIIERYQRRGKDLGLTNKSIQEDKQAAKECTFSMAKRIEFLEVSKRKLLGDGLDLCSIDELHQIENQLERSLAKIRARKNQLFREQIEQLKEEERRLLEQNAELRKKVDCVYKVRSRVHLLQVKRLLFYFCFRSRVPYFN